MDTEDLVCVALLHDVVEDTGITFDDLIKEGFNIKIIEALKLLTHNDNTPYMDYIKRIKNNSLATKVKLTDLKHNSDLTRLDLSKDTIPPKYNTYLETIKYLEN